MAPSPFPLHVDYVTDDPFLAKVTLFGVVSAIFTLGAGPLSLGRALGRTPARHVERGVEAADRAVTASRGWEVS